MLHTEFVVGQTETDNRQAKQVSLTRKFNDACVPVVRENSRDDECGEVECQYPERSVPSKTNPSSADRNQPQDSDERKKHVGWGNALAENAKKRLHPPKRNDQEQKGCTSNRRDGEFVLSRTG